MTWAMGIAGPGSGVEFSSVTISGTSMFSEMLVEVLVAAEGADVATPLIKGIVGGGS